MYVVPANRQEIRSQDLFKHEYLPSDRRWTMLVTVLYSNNVQYGLAMFEMPEERVQDIDTLEDWKMAELKYKVLKG